MTREELMTLADRTMCELGCESDKRPVLAHLNRQNWNFDPVGLLIADRATAGYSTAPPDRECVKELRSMLLEDADNLRDIALALPLPDGELTFKMSREERDAAYVKLRDYTKPKRGYLCKLVVVEASLPGNWGCSLDDGLAAYANAMCPDRWIAYDVPALAYVTGLGGLRLDAEDNPQKLQKLTNDEVFVEICRVG